MNYTEMEAKVLLQRRIIVPISSMGAIQLLLTAIAFVILRCEKRPIMSPGAHPPLLCKKLPTALLISMSVPPHGSSCHRAIVSTRLPDVLVLQPGHLLLTRDPIGSAKPLMRSCL